MINEENLNKLYEGLVNGNELTTKELNNYGFNSKDLTDLIEQGILERVKRGYYSFKLINELFCYGKKLISVKDYDKATLCFEKCYELDPNHFGTCFQLFLRSITKKDYVSSFEYLEVLMNTENPYYKTDNNFYLYLLSIITDVPDKYKEYVKKLKIEDIRVDFNDKRYKYIPQQNNIRFTILQQKFPFALKQLNDLTIQYDSLTLQDIITKTLLVQAVETEVLSKNILLNLISNKQYEEIVNYLEEKQKKHNLSLIDNYILKLVNELINIRKNKQVPEKTIFQSENLFEAINGYNYELALDLSESYNLKNNINNSENIINLLLSEICEMIKEISLPLQTIDEETLHKKPISHSTNTSLTSSFSDVIGFLVKSDLENAFRSLSNYMESINKKEYEFLIVDLIKLSLIEKDIAFTKPMITLTYISRGNFNFDISSYIQEFYVTLTQNRFDEARIYLDIISESNKLGQEYIMTEGLLQVLNNAEKIIENKNNKLIPDDINSQKSNINPTTIKPSNSITQRKEYSYEEIPSSEKQQSEIPVEENTMEIWNREKDFIKSKHEILLNSQGVVLLKPMDNKRRKMIHNIVEEYSDMVSFSIGEGKNRQIVLRYKPIINEYVNVANLLAMGNLAYKEGNYDYCIENYLQVLQFGKPKAFVYAKLGLAYMKKNEKDIAIEYLTIATQLSKQEDGQFEFTELIASLSGLIDKKNKKPRFIMKTEEFGNDINNYYGIENFDEITSHIIDSGLDVETACQEFYMTDEQIDTIKLIYARKFYSQGNYEKGDEFLKSVERSKNKTKFISNLVDEIRRNKRFYINRSNENSQQLVLTLQPGKRKYN